MPAPTTRPKVRHLTVHAGSPPPRLSAFFSNFACLCEGQALAALRTPPHRRTRPTGGAGGGLGEGSGEGSRTSRSAQLRHRQAWQIHPDLDVGSRTAIFLVLLKKDYFHVY